MRCMPLVLFAPPNAFSTRRAQPPRGDTDVRVRLSSRYSVHGDIFVDAGLFELFFLLASISSLQ